MLDDNAYGLSRRRVTLSTSGLVPAIDRLRDACPVALAVSLHAPNDALRDRLVPINRKYPLAELLAACRALPRARAARLRHLRVRDARRRQRPARARARARRARRATCPCKFNLIPFNPVPRHRVPRRARARASSPSRRSLMDAGFVTTIRKTRGDDIDAACGQLAGQVQDRTKRRRRDPPIVAAPAPRPALTLPHRRPMRHDSTARLRAASRARRSPRCCSPACASKEPPRQPRAARAAAAGQAAGGDARSAARELHTELARRLLRARPDGRRARGAQRGRRSSTRTTRRSTTSTASSTRCSARTPRPSRTSSGRSRSRRSDSEIRQNWGWYLCTHGRATRVDPRVRAGRCAIRCTRRRRSPLINAGRCSAIDRRRRRGRRATSGARSQLARTTRRRPTASRCSRTGRARYDEARALMSASMPADQSAARSALPRHVRRAQAGRPPGGGVVRGAAAQPLSRIRPKPRRIGAGSLRMTDPTSTRR